MNSAASRVLGVLRSREMGILLAFVLVVVAVSYTHLTLPTKRIV